MLTLTPKHASGSRRSRTVSGSASAARWLADSAAIRGRVGRAQRSDSTVSIPSPAARPGPAVQSKMQYSIGTSTLSLPGACHELRDHDLQRVLVNALFRILARKHVGGLQRKHQPGDLLKLRAGLLKAMIVANDVPYGV